MLQRLSGEMVGLGFIYIISVEVVNVYKNLHSEKEMINLLEGMISSSLDLKKFMRDKHDILNWGISE